MSNVVAQKPRKLLERIGQSEVFPDDNPIQSTKGGTSNPGSISREKGKAAQPSASLSSTSGRKPKPRQKFRGPETDASTDLAQQDPIQLTEDIVHNRSFPSKENNLALQRMHAPGSETTDIRLMTVTPTGGLKPARPTTQEGPHPSDTTIQAMAEEMDNQEPAATIHLPSPLDPISNQSLAYESPNSNAPTMSSGSITVRSQTPPNQVAIRTPLVLALLNVIHREVLCLPQRHHRQQWS